MDQKDFVFNIKVIYCEGGGGVFASHSDSTNVKLFKMFTRPLIIISVTQQNIFHCNVKAPCCDLQLDPALAWLYGCTAKRLHSLVVSKIK